MSAMSMGFMESDTQRLLETETDLYAKALDRELRLTTSGFLTGSPVAVSATNGKIIDINPRNPVVEDESDFHSLLMHEMAHILFKSNHYIPEKLSKEKDFEKIPLSVIGAMYNIIEDYRIEGNYVTVFPGDEEGFERIKPRLMAKAKPGSIKDPINTLLAARCGMREAVEKGKMTELYDKFATEMAKTKDKDYTASYAVLKTILTDVKDYYHGREEGIKDVLDKFKKRLKEIRDAKEKEEGDKGKEAEGVKEGKDGEGGKGKEGDKGSGTGKSKGKEGEAEEASEGKMTAGKAGAHEGKSSSGSGGTSTGDDATIVMTEDELKELGIEPRDIPEGTSPEDLTPGGITIIIIKKDIEKAKESSPMLKDEESKIPPATAKEKKEIDSASKESEKDILDKAEKKGKEEEKDVALIYNSGKRKQFEEQLKGINNRDPGMTEYLGSRISPSEKIRRALADVKAKATDIPAKYGKRMDIRRAIQKVIRPEIESKPYYRRHLETGAEYWFLLDLSGSMDYIPSRSIETTTKLARAKEILATLYDSVVPYNPKVKFRMFGFVGNELGTPRASTSPPYVFEFDRKRLETLGSGGDNPTGAALFYTSELMRKSPRNADRTMFIITDGIANGTEELDPKTKAVKIIAEGIKKVKETGTKVFTIFVDPSKTWESNETTKASFAGIDKFYGIQHMGDARKILEDEIVTDVAKKIMA